VPRVDRRFELCPELAVFSHAGLLVSAVEAPPVRWRLHGSDGS